MMLYRSFKHAKCKTALKLAVSRIKVLKNISEGQLKRLKGELADLLQSGHEPTARIRVQHLVKEEKTVAAYKLIQMFCEFIIVRFPIIESQKICPIDLKEAISSVVFACPRCADTIPELLDVQKHMTAKYGKEFVSAAVELRPQCGVNRLLVEKMSLKPPDGPTKMKILNTIAEEYGIIWKSDPFGDINDAKYFHALQASCEESPHVQAPPVQHIEMNDVPTTANLYVRNATIAAEINAGNRLTTTYMSFPEIRSSGAGSGSEEMDCRFSYSENNSCCGKGMKNWNMKFKDAASAAHAAAECAERASMAAKAASELSKREKIKRQCSTYELPKEFDKTYSFEHGNLASREASEFPIHGNGSTQFSTEEGQEYSVHDAKHVPAEKASHVHPKLPEYESFAAHFRSLKLNKARQENFSV